MSAELAARRTAAAAVAADFRTAMVSFQRGGPQPDYPVWAQRLERHLRWVLEVPEDNGTAAEAGQLAEIRLVLEVFDWETDDRQYALEQIDDILNGARK